MKPSIAWCLIAVVSLTLASIAPVAADELEFNFQDPKGVNSVTFVVDSPLEPILGVAAGVTGTVKFDPKKPEKMQGSIVVDAKSVHVPNDRMKMKMHTGEWLDSANHGTIEFKVKKVKKAKGKGKAKKGVLNLTAVGEFTCKGKTKEITVPVQISYLEGRLSDRLRSMKGDLLVVRSTFTIKRSDFDINPGMNKEVVGDEVEVRLAVVGYHKKG